MAVEQAFFHGHDEKKNPFLSHLSTKPSFLFEPAAMNYEEGKRWKQKYHKHCQLGFSSYQHHWH